MTLKALALESGIAPNTIRRIENNESDHKINKATATALCTALQKHVPDIFDGFELSHLGRPPMTGKSITYQEPVKSNEVTCLNCFMKVPVAPRCKDCESPLPAASGM